MPNVFKYKSHNLFDIIIKQTPYQLKHEKLFLEKSKVVHKYKYLYDKVKYINTHTKVIITCSVHGDFEQEPASHRSGCGCPKCGRIKCDENRLSNTKIFIEKAQILHKNKYDYSESIYINNRNKITITCPIHGEFKQTPNDHLNRKGCLKCGIKTRSNALKTTLIEFIKNANKVHKNKYDYSKSKYINTDTKIIITCPVHGDFEQRPSDHVNLKRECVKCGLIKRKKTNLERYGVEYPQQNPDIMKKSMITAGKLKPYITPLGKTIYLQGYEWGFYKLCLENNITEDEIQCQPGSIDYIDHDGTNRKYFPDFIIINNTIIEIKSIYSVTGGYNDYKKMLCKAKYALKFAEENNSEYIIVIMDKGQILGTLYKDNIETLLKWL